MCMVHTYTHTALCAKFSSSNVEMNLFLFLFGQEIENEIIRAEKEVRAQREQEGRGEWNFEWFRERGLRGEGVGNEEDDKEFAEMKKAWAEMVDTATYCNTLQRAATCCNTPQHTATCCNMLHHAAIPCSTLQYSAAHCNTLRHTALHCNTLQYTASYCNTLQYTATHCNTLQRTATHCNTLRHTAIHCDTL